MAQPLSEKPTNSKLYKDYFNDLTLSDLTIRLSDRTVHAHRIVLCRGSEYFAKLLTGRFQETKSHEIELHDDDPDAMVALLRFLYDLPYSIDDTERWTKTLKPHAAIYVVADKYQIEPLQSHVYEEMQKIARSSEYLKIEAIDEDVTAYRLTNKVDFVDALRTIYAGTPAKDSRGRKLMIDFLIQNIDVLKKEVELSALLKDTPDLCVEVIAHPDLHCNADGLWDCNGDYCDVTHPACRNCELMYTELTLSRYRREKLWRCQFCKFVGPAMCNDCKDSIWWQPHSVLESLGPKP